VLLWTWWGHLAVLNTAALRALDIADTAADPLGGMSARASMDFSPIACSGAMYCGVPTQARLRHALSARVLHGERDAEVGDERMPALQQNVLGLDVAVDNAAVVRILQRVGDLARELHSVGDGELRPAIEPRAPCFALDERHHVEQLPVQYRCRTAAECADAAGWRWS